MHLNLEDMKVNNFKELERLMISNRAGDGDITKQQIGHTTGIFRFIGNLVELYLPRMVNSLIGNHKPIVKKRGYPNKEG